LFASVMLDLVVQY